jgi:hypothetical protein
MKLKLTCGHCHEDIDTKTDVWYVVIRRKFGQANIKGHFHQKCFQRDKT